MIPVEVSGTNIEIYSRLTVKINFPCLYQKYHTQIYQKLCTVMCADVAFLPPMQAQNEKVFPSLF